jgi:hypothetical protein
LKIDSGTEETTVRRGGSTSLGLEMLTKSDLLLLKRHVK